MSKNKKPREEPSASAPAPETPRPPESKPPDYPAIAAITQIATYTENQMARARNQYYFIGTLVAILVAVGIWFTFHSASEFKAEVRQDAKEQRDLLTNSLAAQEKKLDEELSKQVEHVRAEIAKRVDSAFDDKNITVL